MDKPQLKEYILNAFVLAPPPDPMEIIEHECPECFELRDMLKTYTSLNLTSDLLQDHFDCLPLLSPKALRYYLPAFLCQALDRPDSPVFEFTLYHLSSNDISSPYWAARLAEFSEPEIIAIHTFLAYWSNTDVEPFFREEITLGLQIWSPPPNPSFKRDTLKRAP